MMRIIWNAEAIRQQKSGEKLDYSLISTGKKVKHVYTLFFVISFIKTIDMDIDFRLNYRL